MLTRHNVGEKMKHNDNIVMLGDGRVSKDALNAQ